MADNMPKIKRSNSEPMSLHYMQKQHLDDHQVLAQTPSHLTPGNIGSDNTEGEGVNPTSFLFTPLNNNVINNL